MDPREVDAYTTYGKPFNQLGIDPNKRLLETAVSAHYRQGGVLVDNTTMRSSVAGLYVAGGLGGHSNGLIALATFDGKTVADGILEGWDKLTPGELPDDEVAAEQNRVEALLAMRQPGPSPADIKTKIRSVMWDKVGVEKSAASLSSALEDLAHIRTTLLPTMSLRSGTRTANYEWLDAIDVHNMIDSAELIIHSSIERRESRGPFMRLDFPETDNDGWLAANIMIKTDNGFRFERSRYETPFFEPGFARRDNLSVAW